MTYARIAYLPQFQTADVCAAARIKPATLKNWLARSENMPMLKFGRPAGSSGRAHLFSWYDVISIALTAELVRIGLPVRKAYLVALGFSHVGDTVALDLDQGEDDIVPARGPSELYESGLTYLIATTDEDTGGVVCIDTDSRTFETRMAMPLLMQDSLIVVNVNNIYSKALLALKLDKNFFRPQHDI